MLNKIFLTLNVKMPTPDSSAFTQQLKFNAIQSRAQTGGSKLITHLYKFVPSSSGLIKFLPSFSNKNLQNLKSRTPLYISGIQYKTKRPPTSYVS
jgi:hypothetical protein